jgi:hypothetical protein
MPDGNVSLQLFIGSLNKGMDRVIGGFARAFNKGCIAESRLCADGIHRPVWPVGLGTASSFILTQLNQSRSRFAIYALVNDQGLLHPALISVVSDIDSDTLSQAVSALKELPSSECDLLESIPPVRIELLFKSALP